mmetsp:Transcript_120211/g.239266  ORF Transcript_120211/g.239266 Transcript_120211/m.239266 type:complete len:330 (+) Transcript_120211:179-1168(+)
MGGVRASARAQRSASPVCRFMPAPVALAVPAVPVVGVTARNALRSSSPARSAATPPLPPAIAAVLSGASAGTTGLEAAAQTPTVPGHLLLHAHHRHVPGGAAPIPVANAAPTVAPSGIAAAATHTMCEPVHPQSPSTTRQADWTPHVSGFSPLGRDGELRAVDGSCTSILPGSPRPNSSPLPWDSRGHAADWAEATAFDIAVWKLPPLPLRRAVQSGASLVEGDRGSVGSLDVHQDVPCAARVPMTRLNSQTSPGLCKQQDPYGLSSACRRLRQLSCETADPYAGIQLTPLNDRPFETLASIARQAQTSLMERLAPQGREHPTEHPSYP